MFVKYQKQFKLLIHKSVDEQLEALENEDKQNMQMSLKVGTNKKVL
jgi:hypothetical protein